MFILLKKIYLKYLSWRKPKEYARKIGVRILDYDSLQIHGKIRWNSDPELIEIGKNVIVTNNCNFLTHDGGILIFSKKYPTLELSKPIIINDNCYLGNDVIVLPGVTIGPNVIVGAGSIVTKNLESGYVYAGNPARKIKSLDEYLEKSIQNSTNLGQINKTDRNIKLQKLYFDTIKYRK